MTIHSLASFKVALFYQRNIKDLVTRRKVSNKLRSISKRRNLRSSEKTFIISKKSKIFQKNFEFFSLDYDVIAVIILSVIVLINIVATIYKNGESMCFSFRELRWREIVFCERWLYREPTKRLRSCPKVVVLSGGRLTAPSGPTACAAIRVLLGIEVTGSRLRNTNSRNKLAVVREPTRWRTSRIVSCGCQLVPLLPLLGITRFDASRFGHREI